MQKIQMDIPFRGARDYLQGADLYQFMVECGEAELPAGPVQLQFHSLLRRQGELLVGVDDVASWRKREEYRGEGRFGPPEQARYVVLVETLSEVVNRKACNESEVVKGALVKVAEKSAVLAFPSGGTPMEMVVFLNKQLHFQTLPDVKEKWLFVRLELRQRLPLTGERELKLVLKQVLGNRFTKTEIFIDEVSYGFIIFSTNQ
jgi:hypothetical protein